MWWSKAVNRSCFLSVATCRTPLSPWDTNYACSVSGSCESERCSPWAAPFPPHPPPSTSPLCSDGSQVLSGSHMLGKPRSRRSARVIGAKDSRHLPHVELATWQSSGTDTYLRSPLKHSAAATTLERPVHLRQETLWSPLQDSTECPAMPESLPRRRASQSGESTIRSRRSQVSVPELRKLGVELGS